MRLGLIGVGPWGRKYVSTIAGLEGTELSAVARCSKEAAAVLPANCRIEDDWRAIIEAGDIDGVIISTPPASHAGILIAAIEAEKPTLVEKPVTQSSTDAQAIRTSLDHRPATILVDHIHLFHPAFVALRQEALELGPIRSINSSAGNLGPYRPHVPVLWDWAPHDLAMCLTLVPGPARPSRAVRLDSTEKEGATAETLELKIQLADLIPAQIHLSTLEDRHRWFAVTFDTCTLVYRDRGPDQLVRLARGEDIRSVAGERIAVMDEPPLTRAVREFVARVRVRDVDRTSIDLGLTVVDLIQDIEALVAPRSRSTASPVTPTMSTKSPRRK